MYMKKIINNNIITYEYRCHNCDAVLVRRVDDYGTISVEGFTGDFELNFCPKCGKPIVDIYSKTPKYTVFVSDVPTTIDDCPVGLFECEGEICIKTEYHDKVGDVYRPIAYCVDTGERFHGQEGDKIYPISIAEIFDK